MASIQDVADEIGISPQAVRKLVNAGVFGALSRDESQPNSPWVFPSLQDAVERYRAFKEKTDDAGKDWRLEVTKEDARIKKLRADMLQLQYDEMRGRYHRAEFVRDAMNGIIYYERAAVAALPGKLAPRLAGMTDKSMIAAAIKEEVAEIQEDLAKLVYRPEWFSERLAEAGGMPVADDA